MQSLAASDVNDVRIGNRNRDCTDGRGGLIVKQGLPGSAVVRRFENAAVDRRHIKHVRLRRHTANRPSSSATIRPHISPAQRGVECAGTRAGNAEYYCETNEYRARCRGGCVGCDSSVTLHEPGIVLCNESSCNAMICWSAACNRAAFNTCEQRSDYAPHSKNPPRAVPLSQPSRRINEQPNRIININLRPPLII